MPTTSKKVALPLGDERLVCTRPFEWFEIHPGGDVFACCPAWLKTPLGNLLSDPLETIWNGPAARRIRTAIVDGSFQCCRRSRCPKLRSAAGPVRRVADIVDNEVREAIRTGTTALPYGPKRLHLCFDRGCNLACPSCRTQFHCHAEDNGSSVALLRRLEEAALREAAEIRLSGTGDPFASPVYCRMLRDLQPRNHPRLRRIHLHTNALLWDAPMWRTLSGIHPLVRSAEISVDAATEETYALNRRGGDFSRLLRNLDFVSSLSLRVTLSFVVQANNWREMPAFAQLGARYGFGVYFSRLVNWGTFSRAELARRAVHLPTHPEHPIFMETLEALAPMEHVDLGNLMNAPGPVSGRDRQIRIDNRAALR